MCLGQGLIPINEFSIYLDGSLLKWEGTFTVFSRLTLIIIQE